METIEILFTADRSGLEAELKGLLVNITHTLSVANSQSIDWGKILTKSLTPSLMAGIAGTFALAISQALEFQSAVQAASLNTGTSFTNTTGAMANGAYNISSATGQSANDVEAAIGQVSMVYKDYNDALAVTNGLAQFASTEHMSMADAISTVLPLLQQWNISASDAGNIMATLGQSTSYGKLSIADLVNMLTNAGPALKNLTSLPSAIGQLQAASAVPGFTPSDIKNMFDVVLKGAQNVKDPINSVFTDMGTALQTGGFAKALDAIDSKIKQWGPDAQIIGTTFGLTANTMSDALAKPADAFKDIDAVAQTFLKNLKPLQQWFTENQTILDKFKQAWETLVKDLETAAMPAIIKGLLDVIEGADTLAKIFNEGGGGKTSQDIQIGYAQDFKENASNIFAGGGGGPNIANLATAIKDAFMEGATSLIAGLTGGSVTNHFNFPTNSAAAQSAQRTSSLANSGQDPRAQ